MRLNIERNVSLDPHNCLAVPAVAEYFAILEDAQDLPAYQAWCKERKLPLRILGGGSNVVLPDRVSGLVLKVMTRGVEEDIRGDRVYLAVEAGENWNDFVWRCLRNGWYGLENLVSIPGNVGAAPVQNIGAYGVEVGRMIQAVEGYDLELEEWRKLAAKDCHFRYRDSVFKSLLKYRFVITRVHLRLSKKPDPECSYPALKEAFVELDDPQPEQVAVQVAAIRGKKLPDPYRIPNVGSFFKNPVVSSAVADELRGHWRGIPCWPDGRHYKLSAAWMIEKAGWKQRPGDGVSVHPSQPLVLINTGRRPGSVVLAYAREIRDSVLETFGVGLQIEPEVFDE